MIQRKDIDEVLEAQHVKVINEKTFHRSKLGSISITPDFALVISGIRRCGKSTLLNQIMNEQTGNCLYLNFDTPRLLNFEFTDFKLLDEILKSKNDLKTLFFDEIQVVENWEVYVRGKLDEGYDVVVTGSNASMLSKELGTKLTGRHITKELFPFSYEEFCGFKSLKKDENSLKSYLKIGGFPQYIKTENEEVLHALVNDILYRDIAVRHKIRDEKPLKKLLMFLVGNIGCLISANKLKQIIKVKSSATVLEYLSFFEDSYLVQLIPKFSYSYKVQLVNPKKIYFIDNGLQASISPSFSRDFGRKLENLVFWELRQISNEIFYFNEKNKECDFVVCKNTQPRILIQVCADLNLDNLARERDGLFDAMDFFDMDEGYIVTINQSDQISNKGKMIYVKPFYEMNFEEVFNQSIKKLT